MAHVGRSPFRAGISAARQQRMAQLVVQAQAARRVEGIDPCVYCGAAGTTVDHVPPQSARSRILEFGLVARYPFQEVRACGECNSVLGARGLWTLTERRRFIKQALRRRYADVLRIPDWTDTELAQLSNGLRGYVLSGLYVREFVRERVAYRERFTCD